MRNKIEELKQKGVEDFNEYFDLHPAVVWKLASEIKVLNINEATLRFYGATSKQEMLGSLDKTLYLTDDTYRLLKEELIAIADGTSRVQGETKTKTLNGTVLNILMDVYISNENDGRPPKYNSISSLLRTQAIHFPKVSISRSRRLWDFNW